METEDIAIFSRNHRNYLEAASRRKRTTFRASKPWSTAEQAVKRSGPRPIYIVPIGSEEVEYEARLIDVRLRPDERDPETQRLLAMCLSETLDEGLWPDKAGNPGVRTLYVIGDCRKLKQSFPFTRLKKRADRRPLDAGFRYDYAIVSPLSKLK